MKKIDLRNAIVDCARTVAEEKRNGEVFDEAVIDDIKDMTKHNNHNEAYILICKTVGEPLKDELKDLEEVARELKRGAGLDIGGKFYNLQKSAYRSMMKYVKSHYVNGKDVYRAT